MLTFSALLAKYGGKGGIHMVARGKSLLVQVRLGVHR